MTKQEAAERTKAQLRATWDLFYHAAGVVEVRALLKDAGKGPAWEGWGNTVLGYFDNFDAFAKSVIALENTRRAKSTYLTLNPVGKDLAARAYNRLIGAKSGEGSADKDIVTRRWLLIDCDPIRPEGISSTDEELQTAIGRAQEIEHALTRRGWPAPVPAMSGNGAHRLYRIDLPNDEASRNLLEATLKSLQLQFGETDKEDEIGAQVMVGTIGIKVDMSVFNAARITKLYGTWVRKGDHLEGLRPHRLSIIESIPNDLAVLSTELLDREATIYRDYQRSIEEEKTKQRAQQHTQRAGDNNDVIGAFNQAHPIDETLTHYGYTQGRGNRWSRPGKADSLGVLVDPKSGKSYHFSDNDPMRNGHRVDSFDLYVANEHGGDVTTAVKTAANELKIGARPQVNTNGHSAQPPEWATAAPPVAKEPVAPRKDDQKSTSHLPDDDSYLLTEGAHDEGNARCIHRRYKDRFAHNDEYGWLRYDGTKWVKNGAEETLDRAVVETFEARIGAALRSGQMEHHKAVVQISIPTKGHIMGAKYCLTSLLYVPYSEFETNPDLLNCRNGTINLQTGELLPHNPKDYVMHCSSVDYDTSADQAPWVNYINGAVGEDTASWLQMASGYGLTAHTREEVLFYLFGPARSGKGTFTEAMLSLLGTPLADVVSFHTLTAPREADTQNFNLAPLHSARFIAASESNAYERFNEAKVKQLTGGDKIQCSFKHKTAFSYRPRYKIWLSSNQPINADPDDDAVWGRVRVIHFPNSHLDHEDKHFKEQMRSEAVLRGALVWAVEGAKKWYALGGKGLPEPQKNKDLKDEQRAELDHVSVWIEENCTTYPGLFTPSANLYTNYSEWCKANGVSVKQQKAFSQALKHKGFADKLVKHDGKPKRGFYGLKIA